MLYVTRPPKPVAFSVPPKPGGVIVSEENCAPTSTFGASCSCARVVGGATANIKMSAAVVMKTDLYIRETPFLVRLEAIGCWLLAVSFSLLSIGLFIYGPELKANG